MATLSQLQNALSLRKDLANTLAGQIVTNQEIKNQYLPKIKYAQELGQDIGPLVLKLQSLGYTDPVLLQNNLDKSNSIMKKIIAQIESISSVHSVSSRLGVDGTPDPTVIAADSVTGLIGNRDAELAVNNPDIKIDSGEVPQLPGDWPTEGWL
jgi:hypothetical protein